MPREPSRIRRQLGQELKRLRVRAGLPLRGFGDAIPHPRVHRIEAGTALPTDAQVETWLGRTGADEDVAERVRAITESAHSESVRWSTAIADEDGGPLQQVAADREQASARLLTYEHAHLPGLLQLPSYARALIASFDLGQDAGAEAAARMDRQALLYEPGRDFRFVISEHALRWSPGPEVSMDAQRAKVRDLDSLDAVDVRVLPDSARRPMNGFVIHEGMTDGTSLVVVELEHGQLPLSDLRDVERYQQVFARLVEQARPAREKYQ